MELDTLDRQIIHALRIDSRAPFSRVAEVLGVSDQTVARRYRRMRTAGVVRVVAGVDPIRFGHGNWQIRLRTTPDAAVAVADALARRDDTAWVHLLSGGTEITCVMQAWSAAQRDALLLEKLPRTGRVLDIVAQNVLHIFPLGPEGWGNSAVLGPEQVEAMRPSHAPVEAPVVLEEGDLEMLGALARDGRLPYGELAAVTGRSESTVRRRMDLLRASRAIYFDLEIHVGVLGFHTEVRLWLSVPPSRLVEVGETIATHPEVAFLAATTGRTNLTVAAICRDTRDMFRYLTERVGAIDAIQTVESAPVIRTIKRAGALLPRGGPRTGT
ncbi:AsnC family transcriptional regulator [Virgisporangium aliadipatigenens]|uniref:AsnC family transcriptional regulator n=1 Tax=Virgisporangium aliadipatigenens TaxID=741659 RepID=A0A8J3YFL9_9ACTN|nr:AsnC family transcriptional regulator [Virgisporangium aliadipatigenens]GIJ44294.1 AsnC family transcriptional regulator [Virgisporangium aliadipatigenens]